ncbi:hypothetical protein V8G57_25315 [Collimonas sp. H4R21]|uniref:Uncharacterized protein n=1 Tax=Collimonas rhizosphaerae TaxID=3126357 RepID=A0ABU9Q3E2_9BURK
MKKTHMEFLLDSAIFLCAGFLLDSAIFLCAIATRLAIPYSQEQMNDLFDCKA